MKLLVAFSSLLSILTAVPHISAIPVSSLALPYAGVKVLRIPTGPSSQALANLQSLIHKLNLSSWTAQPRVSSHVDLEVPADKYDEFVAAANAIIDNSGARTKDFAASIEVMHEDLGASIAAETEGMYSPVIEPKVGLVTDAWFNSYHTIADHNQWLNDLVATYPSNSRIVTSGTSVQNRTITGVHIYGSGGPGTKPAIIWHGTVHAREWITTMVTEYLAHQLLLNYANSTEVKGYVDKYDFYIFPIVNPDGFAFTQTSTRLWRKNRQAPPSGSTCYGRDINRNWNYAWAQAAGASTSPCAETYKGLAASDAPETTGLAAFINARKNSAAGAKMFVDWHSYSQLFMTPYGYSCSAVAPDATELNSLAAGFATALRAVSGTRFTTGPTCTTIYQTSGSSTDYAYAASGVKYTFAAELRDTGANGFVLPAAQIRPSGVEVWAGVKYLLANMK